MAKKKADETEEAPESVVAEPGVEEAPATQTPIVGDVDGTQTPNPISDPSQMEKS